MRERPSQISRRRFAVGSAAVAAALFVPRRAFGANERLNVAVVGVGGRGRENVNGVSDAGANIVALCDCDARSAAESFKKFPQAKQYTDWRKMLEAEKGIDAVVVATPDHCHAIISIAAMKLGQHVYCEKPLARSVWEARQMAKVAGEKSVATQMGTQGHSFEGTRRAVEVMRSGTLGEVKELHVWTDRPANWWPQGVKRPVDTPAVPQGLDWDVWLGPAQERPYSPAYVPFKWRGFWDFGTGAIGDMGIHNLDTAYWGLELGPPVSAEVKDCSPAFGSQEMTETAPAWSIIEIMFAGKNGRPPVKMTWYDGGKLPPRDLLHGEKMISRDGGSLAVGSKATLFTRTWHGGQSEKDMFVLLPRKQFEGFKPPEQALPRVKIHHQEWVDACTGKGRSLSSFDYAAGLTEALLLGNLALRTGRKIEWDAANMRASNCPEADAYIKPQFRQGWSI